MEEQESYCLNCGFQEYSVCFEGRQLLSIAGKLQLISTDTIECPQCNASGNNIVALKRVTGRKKYKLEKLAEEVFDYHNSSQLVEDLIKKHNLTFEQGLYFKECILKIVQQEAIKEFQRKQQVLKSIKTLQNPK